MALAALALLWLAAIALGGRVLSLDGLILSALYAGDRPNLAAAAALTTELGGWVVLTLASLAGAVALFVRRRRRDAILLLAIVGGGRILVELQKLWFARVRPAEEHLVAVHSFSFPSGHSANALITYLALAILLLPGRPAAIGAAMVLALLVGCSRVVLGVHWPSDVVGGWAFAGFWLLASFKLASFVDAGRR
jgi:undecaprenyl-diphosphatase